MDGRGGRRKENKMVRGAIETLYTHRLNVYENVKEFNDKTYRHEMKRKIVLEDVPCRVSFISEKTAKDENVSSIENMVKVFTSPEIIIKSGSVVSADVNGNILNLSLATSPAIYKSHREYIFNIENKAN